MIHKLFILTIVFHTPFNPIGIMPIYLCFAFLSLFTFALKPDLIKFSPNLLILLFILMTYITFNSFINLYNININHLAAILTVLVAYFLNSMLIVKKLKFDIVLNTLNLTFKLYVLISICDYVFYYFLIPLDQIIPMELRNELVVKGYLYRLPGFYEEPTNWAGLGIGLGTIYFLSTKDNILKKLTYMFFFIAIITLTRSAPAVVLAFTIPIIHIIYNVFLKKSFRPLLTLIPFFSIGIIILSNLEILKLTSVIRKITLDGDVSSVSGRISGWTSALETWSNGSFFEILLGRGIGYAEFNLGSIHSWILTLLLELGLIGFAVMMLFIFWCVYKGLQNIQDNYVILLAFFTQFMTLFTNTQFYHPLFWILLSILACGNHYARSYYK